MRSPQGAPPNNTPKQETPDAGGAEGFENIQKAALKLSLCGGCSKRLPKRADKSMPVAFCPDDREPVYMVTRLCKACVRAVLDDPSGMIDKLHGNVAKDLGPMWGPTGGHA